MPRGQKNFLDKVAEHLARAEKVVVRIFVLTFLVIGGLRLLGAEASPLVRDFLDFLGALYQQGK
jgi:hypothetical protein